VAILDNWAMRSLNYSGGKPITNMCGYPRDPAPMSNYTGSFCSMRALITYAFFFKYMLDKGYDKGTEVGDNDVLRTELFGNEGGAAATITIKDFAKEYVKILDIWQSIVDRDYYRRTRRGQFPDPVVQRKIFAALGGRSDYFLDELRIPIDGGIAQVAFPFMQEIQEIPRAERC
jgi:hypothetical protein